MKKHHWDAFLRFTVMVHLVLRTQNPAKKGKTVKKSSLESAFHRFYDDCSIILPARMITLAF